MYENLADQIAASIEAQNKNKNKNKTYGSK
jgi:hypothetical protein